MDINKHTLLTDEYNLKEDTVLVYNNPIPTIPDRDKFDMCIPVIPDMHILASEPANRNGVMIDRGLQIFDELIKLVEVNRCTSVIFTGDITDRGFNKGELTYESQIQARIAKMSDTVNGNCFSVLGNHECTYAKNNLFYTIASIDSNIIKEQLHNKPVPKLVYPYIRTPNCLDFGDLKIHLLHFNKSKKYKITTDNTPINIGIYHDDLISFESKMELYHHKLGNGIDVLNTDIFENVNWAILGHIHKPLNTFKLDNLRGTVIDNPGSMISRSIDEKHEVVNLPFICVNSEGLHRRYVEFRIGDYEETINHEVVHREKQQREMVKLLKKEKENTNWLDYDSFISGISNMEVRQFIGDASKPLILKSTELKEQYNTPKEE